LHPNTPTLNILRWKNIFYLLIIISAAALYIKFITSASFVLDGRTYYTLFDDAMISMKYAQNFAAGNGLVWNPGEYVEGYTNFLWVVWMSVLHLLPFHESKISMLVSLTGAIILILNLLVVKSLAAKVSENSFTVIFISLVFTAFYYGLIFWTLRGMEVGIITLLTTYSMLLIFRLQDFCSSRNYIKLIAALTSILLLRSDGVVLVIFFLVCFLITVKSMSRKKNFLRLAGIMLLVIAAHTLFRFIYYDDLLPNTYYLKLAGIPYYDRLYRGTDTFLNIFLSRLLPLVIPVVLFLIFFRREFEKRKVYCLSGLFIVSCFYSVFVGGDSWEWMPYANRFITVSIPSLIILFALSAEKLFYKNRSIKIFTAASGIFLIYILIVILFYSNALPEYSVIKGMNWINKNILILASSAFFLTFTIILFKKINTGTDRAATILNGLHLSLVCILSFQIINEYAFSSWMKKDALFSEQDSNNARLGIFLEKNTATDIRIADVWAGSAPYFSHRYFIDLLGKMDKHIAKGEPSGDFFLPGHSKWDQVYSIKSFTPDLILHLRETNPSGTLKEILDNEYETLSNGFYMKKGTVKFDRKIFEK